MEDRPARQQKGELAYHSASWKNIPQQRGLSILCDDVTWQSETKDDKTGLVL